VKLLRSAARRLAISASSARAAVHAAAAATNTDAATVAADRTDAMAVAPPTHAADRSMLTALTSSPPFSLGQIAAERRSRSGANHVLIPLTFVSF
jgi:hypothetical protein